MELMLVVELACPRKCERVAQLRLCNEWPGTGSWPVRTDAWIRLRGDKPTS